MEYDTSTIRKLLMAAFSSDELRRIGNDKTENRQRFDKIGANASMSKVEDAQDDFEVAAES